MFLILFDIDGTLLSCGPQIRPLFGEALREVYGRTGPLDAYDFSGRTDTGIVLDLMSAAGIDRETARARLPEMQEAYLRRLEAGLRVEGMRLLPGVGELLADLAAREDVLLGLLTGNWRRGARIKLSRFDLGRFFSFGAFGDDGVERPELVPHALRRAAAVAGRSFEPHRTLIVGDSLLDVGCARAHGLPSLAVATGRTAAADLAAAGADWVVDDFGGFHPCFAELAARSAA